MNDIRNYETFIRIKPINKGWSSDKKYYVETVSGEKHLLRVADISEYEQKSREVYIMKRMLALGINMSKPIDFGTCCNEKNVYQLLTWCEGEEAKVILSSFSKKRQYEFGKKAGEFLRRINTVEIYPKSSKWSTFYGEKVNSYIDNYKSCEAKFEEGELFIFYLKNNFQLMNNRPTCLTHEDFQTDNLVISPEEELYVIDFEQCGIVDPYYSLMSAMVSAEQSPSFAKGQIEEYFDGKIPDDFWSAFLFYSVAETINGFVIANTLGEEEQINFTHNMIKSTLEYFDNMNSPIPSWYSSEAY